MIIHCVCGDAPHCPFHAPTFHGETRTDRIHREAREAVRARQGTYNEHRRYGGTEHDKRRRFDAAVLEEVTKRLTNAGLLGEVGLATPESIAAQRAFVAASRPALALVPAPVPVAGKPWNTPSDHVKTVSDGYEVVRVPVRGPAYARDRYEAQATLKHEPWFADLRYLGCADTMGTSFHLFERPSSRLALKRQRSTADALKRERPDPLANIRKYQVGDGAE